MSASIYAKPNGTQAALQVNGVDSLVFDVGGTVSGVRKSSVTEMPTLGTSKPTTSGTSIDFTDIPSWVKRLTVMLNLVSTAGTSPPMFQLGSTTFASANYKGASSFTASTVASVNLSTGFILNNAVAATNSLEGAITFTHMSGNLWVGSGMFATDNGIATFTVAGSIQLAGILDRVRLTTVNGTDTFDAGSINILYE